jgi:hypothetical protein
MGNNRSLQDAFSSSLAAKKATSTSSSSLNRQFMIKPLTKELADKEIDFIANNSNLSRAEIQMWHQKFLVRINEFHLLKNLITTQHFCFI